MKTIFLIPMLREVGDIVKWCSLFEIMGGGEERHAQAETLCTHATAKYLLLHSEAIPPFSSSAQGKQFFLSGSILLCTT